MNGTVSAGGRGKGDSLEPPTWELPGLVPAERIVARTEHVVISVGEIRVFSAGALVTFSVRFRTGDELDDDERAEEFHRLLKMDGTSTSERLVLGVRLGHLDGSSGAIVGGQDHTVPRRDTPGLHGVGASGSSRRLWRLTYWLWPAPPDDTTFFAAWPARDVDLGEATIAGDELRAARAAVQQLD